MQDACQEPPLFDAGLYLASNPDLRRAFDAGEIGDPLEHWLARGAWETGRGARPTVLGLAVVEDREPDGDALAGAAGLATDWYFATNPGLGAALGHDGAQARRHWLRHGATEGRPGFGARPPWWRAARDPSADDRLPAGFDLFVDADPDRGAEAVLGRRALAALRVAGIPVSVRAWTARRGRPVLAREELDRAPTFSHALLAASPADMRRLLAVFGPARFARQRLYGLVGSAPLAPLAADWPLLATLDGLLVAGEEGARLARAVSPVPVHGFTPPAAPLAERAAARRVLGLPLDRAVTLLGTGLGGVDRDDARAERSLRVRAARASAERSGMPVAHAPWSAISDAIGDRDLAAEAGGVLADAPGSWALASDRDIVLDDQRDLWSGASLLLAACDRWRPGPDACEADRADATRAGIAVEEGGFLRHRPSARPLATVLRQMLDRSSVSAACGPARALPVPHVPAPTGAPDAAVPWLGLTLLIDTRASIEAERDAVVFHLLGLVAPPAEIALVVPAGVDGRARRDPRVRVALDLATAAAIATGDAVVPLTTDAARQLTSAHLAAIAARLAAPDRPDVLLAIAVDEASQGEIVASGFASPFRHRIEGAVTWPLAVRAAGWRRDANAACGFGAAMGYAVLLAALRAGDRIGAVPATSGLPELACADPQADPVLVEAARRALRHHLRLTGRGGIAVDRGASPGAWRFRPLSGEHDHRWSSALLGPPGALEAATGPWIAERHAAATVEELGRVLLATTTDLVLVLAAGAAPVLSDFDRLRAVIEDHGAGAARFDHRPEHVLARRSVLLSAIAGRADEPVTPGLPATLGRWITASGERIGVLGRE